ncbi:MAG: DUF3261 domain-containing protein [Planctomycetes bacterium]|nr:DUF3261 domain-containing protein [Planctomycetota bacterium]
MSSGRTLLAILLAAALAACRGVPYAPAAAAGEDDLPLRAALTGALESGLPASFRMAHRVVIVAGERQFDCLGVLVMRRGAALRALAVGEMGGRLFDFLARGAEQRVLLRPEGMPEEPLCEGVLADLLHLFDPRAGPRARAARAANGRLALLVEEGESTREYLFDAAGETLVSSLEARDGEVVRRASYSAHRLFPGAGRSLPARIVLENLRFSYRLEIDLLEFSADSDPDAAFAVP